MNCLLLLIVGITIKLHYNFKPYNYHYAPPSSPAQQPSLVL